jgi:serine/threonine protein kinase
LLNSPYQLLAATQNFDEGSRIGAGGFGEVYRGVMHAMDVAIKRIRHGGGASLQLEKTFWAEVEALSKARHPNIIALLGCCPDQHLLVYEYFEGGSLQDYLGLGEQAQAQVQVARGPMPWAQRLRVVLQVASGLDYLHGQGILHMCGFGLGFGLGRNAHERASAQLDCVCTSLPSKQKQYACTATH